MPTIPVPVRLLPTGRLPRRVQSTAPAAIAVVREGENPNGTWGHLMIWTGSSWTLRGYTLEPRRATGKGPIPAGEYAFSRWVSPRLGNTLRLADVPGFRDILLHVGNWQRETSGCILVGLGVDSILNPAQLQRSRLLIDKLFADVPQGLLLVQDGSTARK